MIRKEAKALKQAMLDRAVENYPDRPQPEANEQRLVGLTKALEIRKNTEWDEADKITLNKN